MKITAIRQQQKRNDRYSIFVDGKYSFSLSEGALLESKISTGQELSCEQVKNFKKLSADDKVYGNALRFAAMRLRSEWEMRDYLRRKQVDELAAATIVQKLEKIGFINDTAFARGWVENRRLLKSVSRRRLVQELKQKRVSQEIINEVLETDDTDERQTLRELADKKRKQAKYREDPLKLMQYLGRQGFDYDDIKEVLRSAD